MITTRNNLGAYAGLPKRTTSVTASCPPAYLEYTWYVSLAYAILGEAWGVHIYAVSGVLSLLVAAASVLSVVSQASWVYKPVISAFFVGASVIAIQYLFHNERSTQMSFVFVGWLINVITVQALAQRPGFLHRFAWAAFAIGLCIVPFVQVSSGRGLIRAGASGTGLASANALGMWFGFCTVYFLVLGLQSRNLRQRAVSWAAALGSLGMVLLALSRGPLVGIILACAVGFLPAAKRYFFPLLCLILLVCLVYVSGVFQEMIDGFFIRGMEETGRGLVWPVALQGILGSPWTGAGMDAIWIEKGWQSFATPHNALLYIGLGAGIIPVAFFLGYLARVGMGAFRIMPRGTYVGETVLLRSLVTFAFLEAMQLDTAFMYPWTVVVFGLAVVECSPHRANRDR